MKLFFSLVITLTVALLTPSLRAAFITTAGVQQDFGPGWRTPATAKTLDVDTNNVFGSDGYHVVNRPAVLPAYVSAMSILTGTFLGNAGYAAMDDPLAVTNTFVTGTMNPFPGLGLAADIISFTLSATPTNRVLRVGLLVDNLDIATFNAQGLQLVQANGGGATSAVVVTTSASFNNRVPDWLFFDITGGVAGDSFVVRGKGGTSGAATLGGVTFDSAFVLVVLNTNDAGPGSLRQALAEAAATPGADTIIFDPALSGQSIALLDPLAEGTAIIVSDAAGVTVDATGLPGGITITRGATNQYRLFFVDGGAFTLRGLTLANGDVGDYPADGGAIYNNRARLRLERCNFSGHRARNGGAIFDYTSGETTNGSTTLEQCTLADNTATEKGGALANYFGLMVLKHCTVTGNTAPAGSGGGVFTFGLTMASHSIIAGNRSSDGSLSDDLGGTVFASEGHNLIGVGVGTGSFNQPGDSTNHTAASIKLSPLANNGGSTKTMLPLPGSPAIDPLGGATTSVFATDQRGADFARVLDGDRDGTGTVDIGAVEFHYQYFVTTTNDAGPGSLRQALADAALYPGPDTIIFDPALSGQSIGLNDPEADATAIVVNDMDGVTVDATGLSEGLTVTRATTALNYRLFFVDRSAFTLRGLTLINGGGSGFNNDGGAVYNYFGKTTLVRCTLSGHRVRRGGAVYNFSSMNSPTTGVTLDHCTLTGNTAASHGGAVFNPSGYVVLTHCTVSGNSGLANHGSGVSTDSFGTTTVGRSIIAGNAYDDVYVYVNSTTISAGHNLIGTGNAAWKFTQPGDSTNHTAATIQLAPLGAYGGPTPTMALLPGSPGRNAATNSTATSDQRGFPIVGTPDIGAYEAGTLHSNFHAFVWESLPTTNAAAHAAGFDYDSDGASNTNEWLALTDPATAASALRILNLQPVAGNNLLITFPTVSNRSYTLWTATTVTGVFTNTGLFALAGHGGARTFTHFTGTNAPQRFYQVQAGPQ